MDGLNEVACMFCDAVCVEAYVESVPSFLKRLLRNHSIFLSALSGEEEFLKERNGFLYGELGPINGHWVRKRLGTVFDGEEPDEAGLAHIYRHFYTKFMGDLVFITVFLELPGSITILWFCSKLISPTPEAAAAMHQSMGQNNLRLTGMSWQCYKPMYNGDR